MLINVSPKMGRSEVDLEIGFKLVRSCYQRSQVSILNVLGPKKHLDISRISSINTEEDLLRIINDKVVLKNTFILDEEEECIIYYGRDKTDEEKFKELAEDLF